MTEDQELIAFYIEKTWPKFVVKTEVPLAEMFDQPKNVGLRHIWKFGICDIVVYKDDKIRGVIEPGGAHHITDEKQIRNDKRKFMLCKQNGVSCLHIMNGIFEKLSKRQQRRVLGKVLY